MSYLKNKKEQINNEINILEERIKKLIVEANNCLVNSYNVVMYKKFISFVMMSMITCIFASDLKNILSFLPLNLIPTGIIGIDLIGSALINKIVLKNNKKINFVQNIK